MGPLLVALVAVTLLGTNRSLATTTQPSPVHMAVGAPTMAGRSTTADTSADAARDQSSSGPAALLGIGAAGVLFAAGVGIGAARSHRRRVQST